MQFLYSKLRGKIVEKFGSISAYANELGVPKQTLSKKLTGKVGFTKKDILKWCEELDISIEEIGIYFFTQ